MFPPHCYVLHARSHHVPETRHMKDEHRSSLLCVEDIVCRCSVLSAALPPSRNHTESSLQAQDVFRGRGKTRQGQASPTTFSHHHATQFTNHRQSRFTGACCHGASQVGPWVSTRQHIHRTDPVRETRAHPTWVGFGNSGTAPQDDLVGTQHADPHSVFISHGHLPERGCPGPLF